MSDAIHHVIIVGGGFAGLTAARHLDDPRIRVTLLDRRNHHLFQPLLYQVATAGLSAPDIAAPLRHILRRQTNVEVRLAEVVNVDLERRKVHLGNATTMTYDSLLLASGATHSYFGHDEWAEHAPGLKTIRDALQLRQKLLLAFERAEAADDPTERDAWLSFAIIGAGPTGVELAGTLAEIARHTLKSEFRRIDPATARVRLIEAGPTVLASFPRDLTDRARAQLERLGVEVVTGQRVTHIDAGGYRLGDSFFAARTIVWAAGVQASPLGRTLGMPVDQAGRVVVEPDLSIPGHPNVFVLGDLASVQHDGKPVPGIAPAAKQMGRYAAATIRGRLAGRPPSAFAYRDTGNWATIGRMAAVVQFRRLKLSGLLAWWGWLAAHVFFLIGFRNRFVVLTNWAMAYWTYRRAARVITEEADFAPREQPDRKVAQSR